MSTSIQHLLCGALLTLASANASATSACRDPDGCLDDFPVMMLYSAEAQLKYCPAFASLNEAQKKKLLQKEFSRHGSPGYLDRLRATDSYVNRPDMAAYLKENTDGLEKMCSELVIKPK